MAWFGFVMYKCQETDLSLYLHVTSHFTGCVYGNVLMLLDWKNLYLGKLIDIQYKYNTFE